MDFVVQWVITFAIVLVFDRLLWGKTKEETFSGDNLLLTFFSSLFGTAVVYFFKIWIFA